MADKSNARKSVTFKGIMMNMKAMTVQIIISIWDNSSKNENKLHVNVSKEATAEATNLKSAFLKKIHQIHQKPNQIIFQSNNSHQSTGVFDISRSTDGSNKAFVRGCLSIGLEKCKHFIESNDNAG